MKSSPRDPVPKNKRRYFILENPKKVLYTLQNILKKKTKQKLQREYLACEALKKLEKQTKNGFRVHKKGTQIFNLYKRSASNVKICTNYISSKNLNSKL